MIDRLHSASIAELWQLQPTARYCARHGRGLSERSIMAKGKNSRKEVKKPKKEKAKTNAAADSNKSGTTIAGKNMQ